MTLRGRARNAKAAGGAGWHGAPKRPEPPNLRIRRARRDDLDRIVDVERASFSTPWSRDTFEAVMAQGVAVVLVAERDGEVVGHGVMWQVADEAEVANLAVAPAARRNGVARALLERMIEDAGASGATAVFLEVRLSNQAAAALYEGRGFRQVGVRAHYYDRPREHARVLRFDLDR